MCDLNAAPPRALLCSSEIYERVFPAAQFPLFALSRHRLVHRTFLLLTQSGHWLRRFIGPRSNRAKIGFLIDFPHSENCAKASMRFCTGALDGRKSGHELGRCSEFVGSARRGAMPQFNLFKSSEQPVAKTPACPNCGRAMRLYDISRSTPGCKRLIFSCSECAQQRTALVEYEEVDLAS